MKHICFENSEDYPIYLEEITWYLQLQDYVPIPINFCPYRGKELLEIELEEET